MDTKQAFGKARGLITAYGVMSVVVLLTLAVLALTGHTVTSFLWGRSGGVLASAAVAYWFTVAAARGARWAYLRIRIISVLMPFAIIGIDLIPGACPAWFLALQATCAVPIAAAAFVVNGATLRATFPKAA